MSDVRQMVDGSTTVRVSGLDAKAASLGAAQFELEMLLSDGVHAAGGALAEWRGVHATTFVEEANVCFAEAAQVVQVVSEAKRVVTAWPDPAGHDPLGEEHAASARVDVPADDGTSAAVPETLDEFRLWCEDLHERLPSLTRGVGLDGVTAEVTTVTPMGELLFGGALDPLDAVLDRTPTPLLDPETTTETVTADPATYVDLPDVSGAVTASREAAAQLGPWTGAVALAFREGDERLLDLIQDYPELADELLAGFEDEEMGAESSLVVLLAYFDIFDEAKTGDEDGEVSMEDLWILACNTEYPPYVARAAEFLHSNQQLFDLVETMNDDMEYARDIVGGNGDGKISTQDIETFLELNDQLAIMEQNFEAFDTAAHPDDAADGEVTANDLEALSDGDGELAAAASWLLDHSGAHTRLAWYQRAKEGFLGEKFGEQPITTDSLVLLTADQQTYTDDPDQSAAFVDRRLETLMSAEVGGLVAPAGMNDLFDNALTGSDQRAELMERVIGEVADDGTIHNSGLHGALANGAASNMPVLDGNIDAPFAYGPDELPDDVRHDYLNTHDFLREVSRDADAAERLRRGVFDYGMAETAQAPDAGDERGRSLEGVGRVQAFLDISQDNALTGAALEDIRAAAEQAPGPSVGSVTNYAISHVPALSTVNGIAGGMGIDAGTGVDWLASQLGQDSNGPFNNLSDAEQIDSARRTESRINRSVWVALDGYESSPAVRDSAEGLPFVEENGELKSDLSVDEAQAFREWATSLPRRQVGPAWSDDNQLDGGYADVISGDHGIDISDRR